MGCSKSLSCNRSVYVNTYNRYIIWIFRRDKDPLQFSEVSKQELETFIYQHLKGVNGICD